jgi:hypothetical protein
MSKLLETHGYRIAIVCAVLGLVAAFVLLLNVFPDFIALLTYQPSDPNTGEGTDGPQAAMLIISALGLIVTTVGTSFTVIVGWRKERRDVTESQLKIKQLEIEVTRLNAANRAAE